VAPHRVPLVTSRRRPVQVEYLEDRVLLSEMAAWVGQVNEDYVGRDGRSPDGYQDIDIRLLGLDTTKSVTSVEVQRQGGGVWTTTGGQGSQVLVIRSRDAATGSWSTEADVYFEPYFNDPVGTRYEQIRIRYEDGTAATVYNLYSTSVVDTTRRVEGKELGVSWVGQDGKDYVGPGLGVGPDGVQDLHLKLSNLLDYTRGTDNGRITFNVDTDSVVLTMPAQDGSVVTWIAGPRPSGLTTTYNKAEIFLDPSDPTRANVYLNPVANLVTGGVVSVNTFYQRIGKRDANPDTNPATSQTLTTVAPDLDPALAAPTPSDPAVPVLFATGLANWDRQDPANSATPGHVHITLSGLPAGWDLAEAVLTNSIGSTWTLNSPSPSLALRVQRGDDPTRADLSFAPDRNEANTLLSLRFRLKGSLTQTVVQLHGSDSDPSLRDALPKSSSITVDPSFLTQPGQDLNSLVRQYGTIHFKAGVYNFTAPIDLSEPVSLLAEPGTTFSFSQAPTSPAWAYAIKVRRSHTTIDGTAAGGLAIRFSTPIRWTTDFQMNPAVIGSDYAANNGLNPKVDINFRNLDIDYAPTGPTGAPYNFSVVRLIRGNYNDSGTIAGNILRGGSVEVWGGPWTISRNDYRGAAAGTSVSPVFAVRDGHDILIESNHARQLDPTGITYTFALFTGTGAQTTVRNNVVDGGIGRDAAKQPGGGYNFPELILTEAYYPHYEGMALVNPATPRLLKVSTLRGAPGKPGDIVAILSGSSAGKWFRVTQTVDAQNYVVDGDLPLGNYAVSISAGFVNDLYEGNTLDTSSLTSSSSVAFQLAGTHVGTIVRDNLVIGARPFFITSTPTQGSYPGTPDPAPWGWTHLPMYGLTIERNTFRNPVTWVRANTPTGWKPLLLEAVVSVEHGQPIRENQGRLYLTASIDKNEFIYTSDFLENFTGDITALRIADPGSLDVNELRILSLKGNKFTTPSWFKAEGRQAGIRIGDGGFAEQELEPPNKPPPGQGTPVTGRSLNQDGSDYVGKSSSSGLDGLQDIHLVLAGLRTDLEVSMIDVYPYGGGAYQYATSGLPKTTPGLRPGDWRAAFLRGSNGENGYSATADLYVQPYQALNGWTHFDIRVTYSDGSVATLSVFGVEVVNPSLPVGAPPPRVMVTSIGMDQSDYVGSSNVEGPDGIQDLRFVLSGLPTNKAIVQLDVFPYGYGQFQYVNPLALSQYPGIQGAVGRNAGYWRAAVIRTALGPGVYAGTADVYIASLMAENGIQRGTLDANHFDFVITFEDGTTIRPVAWGIVGQPNTPVTKLSATSNGQDAVDLVGPGSATQPDSIQDLHLSLNGLRRDSAIRQVEVWAFGGGEWNYSSTSESNQIRLNQKRLADGSFVPTAELYLAPNPSFIDAAGNLVPLTFHLVVHYADGTRSEELIIPGVVADPRLAMPTVTSLNQDGEDWAALNSIPAPDGRQDVHLTLANLPSDKPLSRVVIRRVGSGETYLSDGSAGSWAAAIVQNQVAPGVFASTADIYFEPGPNALDHDQVYQIDLYLGGSSRKTTTLTARVTATPGLAVSPVPETTSAPSASSFISARGLNQNVLAPAQFTTSTADGSVGEEEVLAPFVMPVTNAEETSPRVETAAQKFPAGPLRQSRNASSKARILRRAHLIQGQEQGHVHKVDALGRGWNRFHRVTSHALRRKS